MGLLILIGAILIIAGLFLIVYGCTEYEKKYEILGAIIETLGLFSLIGVISLSIIHISNIPGTTEIVTNPQIYKIIYDDETAKAVEILTEEGDIHTIEEFNLKRNVNIEKSYIVKTEYIPHPVIKILTFHKSISEYVLYIAE